MKQINSSVQLQIVYWQLLPCFVPLELFLAAKESRTLWHQRIQQNWTSAQIYFKFSNTKVPSAKQIQRVVWWYHKVVTFKLWRNTIPIRKMFASNRWQRDSKQIIRQFLSFVWHYLSFCWPFWILSQAKLKTRVLGFSSHQW